MGCYYNQDLYQNPTLLSSKMDLSQKKLTITGWWLLQAATANRYPQIIGIQDKETTSVQKRKLALLRESTSDQKVALQQISDSCNNPSVTSIDVGLNPILVADYNNFKNVWIFISLSIDLNLQYFSINIYSSLNNQIIWQKLTGVTCFNSFPSNYYLNYGVDHFAYYPVGSYTEMSPGCGYVKNVWLYPNLAFPDQTQVDIYLLMKQYSTIQIYIPGNQTGYLYSYKEQNLSTVIKLIDLSQNQDHQVGSTTNYIYQNDNQGLFLDADLLLDKIPLEINSFAISFWMKMPNDPYVSSTVIFTAVFNFEIYNQNTNSPFSFKWNSQQLTNLSSIQSRAWSHLFVSCNYAVNQLINCHFTNSRNGLTYKTQFLKQTSSSTKEFTQTTILFKQGLLNFRDIMIMQGSLFNNKDSNYQDCAANCQLYLSNGHCIYCDTGYVIQPGQINTCIASSSCTSIDTRFNVCLDSKAYCQNIQLKPSSSCSACIDSFYQSNGFCLKCKFGCKQCSDANTCTTCESNRSGANCDCPANYIDDHKQVDCIPVVSSSSRVLPSLVKYVKLTQTHFTTIACGAASNPATPANTLDYAALSGSQFSTTQGKKISFSMWQKFQTITGDYEQYSLLMLNGVVSVANRVLYFASNQMGYHFYIYSVNGGSFTGLKFMNDDTYWIWAISSLNLNNLQLSAITYTPNENRWNYNVISSLPYASIDYSDLRVHFGTMNAASSVTCLMYGDIDNVYYYQGIAATDIGIDQNILFGMMAKPVIPFYFWNLNMSQDNINQDYYKNYQDIYSLAVLSRSLSADALNVMINYNYGIRFIPNSQLSMPVFQPSDFIVHYWFYCQQQFYKNIVTIFAIIQTTPSQQIGYSISHYQKIQMQKYFIQVCYYGYCINDKNEIFNNRWNFIAVSFQSEKVNQTFVQIYTNYKYNNYFLVKQSGITFNSMILMYYFQHESKPMIYIKDFGIEDGGGLLAYSDVGFSTALPHCILRTFKSSLAAGSNYCLACEWGYYVTNGTCSVGNIYCQFESSPDCQTTCLRANTNRDSSTNQCLICSGSNYKVYGTQTCTSTASTTLYVDPILKEQISSSMSCPESYYANSNSKVCESKCSQTGEFGNPYTKTCSSAACPSLYFQDTLTKRCVLAINCPENYIGYSGQCILNTVCTTTYSSYIDAQNKLCVSKCPNFYFGHPTSKLCVQSIDCPTNYLGNTVTNLCIPQENCPINYYKDSIQKFCTQTCRDFTYGDSSSMTCLVVSSCPTDYYGDISTQTCTNLCKQQAFGNTISKICTYECPAASFYNSINTLCGPTCFDNTYNIASTMNCVTAVNCPSNYYGNFETKMCVLPINCPLNQFADSSTKLCTSSCASSTYGNYDTNTCVAASSCPTNFYGDPPTKTCVAANNCTTNYYSDSTTRLCVTSCPGSTYGDPTTRKCEAQCSTNLLGNPLNKKCEGNCPSPNYFNDSSLHICVTTCPTNFYADSTTQLCVATCPSIYYGNTQNKLCVSTCPANQFKDIATKLCQTTCSNGYFAESSSSSCVTTCTTQWGEPSTQVCVDTCPQNQANKFSISANRQCTATCPDGTFAESVTFTCISRCQTNYYGHLPTKTCVQTCPAGMYGDAFVNQQCTSPCPDTYFANLNTKLCVPLCPDPTFGDPLSKECRSDCQSNYFKNTQTRICVTTCPDSQYKDTLSLNCELTCTLSQYADPTTKFCVKTCTVADYYGDINLQQCVQVCSNYFFADPTSKTCVLKCPQSYFGEFTTQKCLPQCPAEQNLFGDPSSNTCLTKCPYKYFGDTATRVCVLTCPAPDYFGDTVTQLCVNKCPSGYFGSSALSRYCVVKCPDYSYADSSTQLCVAQCPIVLSIQYYGNTISNDCVTNCPQGYFGDASSKMCVSACPQTFFGDVVSSKCVQKCPNGYFGNPVSLQCSTTCPPIYFQDSLTSLCTTICSAGQFADTKSKKCLSTCPTGLFGDSIQGKCVSYCSPSYYAHLATQLCVNPCPNLYYADSASQTCLSKCPSGVSIGDPRTKKCVDQCAIGDYIDIASNICVAKCQSGLYGDPITQKCVASCPTSLYSDSSVNLCVTICSAGLFGDATQSLLKVCVQTCPNNYFGDTSLRKCMKICPLGKFGESKTALCVSTCPEGFYGDPVSSLCTAVCSYGLFGDSLTSMCVLSCPSTPQDTYGDQKQGKCVTLCPSETFGNPVTRLCDTTCPPSAQFGDPTTTKCQYVCPQGYFGDTIQLVCVAQCPENYYGDVGAQRKCLLICTTTDLFGDETQRSCVNQCPKDQFGDSISKLCVPKCPQNYFGDPVTSKCSTSCSASGYYGEQTSQLCVTKCPTGQLGDPKTKLCSTICSSGQYVDQVLKLCVSTCPTGYYGDFGTKICVQNCLNGQLADATTAMCVTTCPTGYFGDIEKSHKCLQTCPVGYYGDSFQKKCVQNCTAEFFADVNTQLCVQKCPTNYYGDYSTKSCVAVCPDSFFALQTTQLCVTSCPADFFADPTTKKCASGCPSTYYGDISTRSCLSACTAASLLFADPVLNLCVDQCSINYLADSKTMKCQTQCPTGYAPDTVNRKCVIGCPANKFGDPTTLTCVTTCPTNYFYDYLFWQCVLTCPKGLYSESVSRNCTQYCPSGKYGDSYTRKCVTQCPSHTFGNSKLANANAKTLNVCEECDAACKECTNSTSFDCKTCNDKFFLKTTTNPNNVVVKQCLECHTLCTVCAGGSTQFTCSACIPLVIYHAAATACTEKCQEFPGLYPDLYQQTCKTCNPMCKTCTGPTEYECSICKDEFYLTNFVCIQCISPCVKCFGPEQDQCYSCVQLGYFFEAPSMCKQCPDMCTSCTSLTVCTACQKNRQGSSCNCNSIEQGKDFYPLTMWCSSCSVAVLDIKFSDDWKKIFIKFEQQIVIVQQSVDLHQQCVNIFQQDTVLLLGQQAKCYINTDTQDSIIIEIFKDSLIQIDNNLLFQSGSIKKQACGTTALTYFDLNIVKSSTSPQPFNLSLISQNYNYSLCEQIYINISDIQNDGMRGPMQIIWSLYLMNPIHRINRIQILDILDTANTLQQLSLKFNSSFFINDTEYTFYVICYNWFGQSINANITIHTYLLDEQQYCSKCPGQYQENFNCTECISNTIFQQQKCTRTCIEFPGTYPDLENLQCKKCNQICVNCTGPSEYECTFCVDNYYLEDSICKNCNIACYACTGPNTDQCSICNPGYYHDFGTLCLKCPDACQTCTSLDNCQTCIYNREGKLCQCPKGGYDYAPRTYYCGTCQIAIVNIKFSSNWMDISIEFDFTIALSQFSLNDQEALSYQKCSNIFPKSILDLLGPSCKCQVIPQKRNAIIIQLDKTATIEIGQQLSINEGTIYNKIRCNSNSTFNQIIFDQVQQNDYPNDFQVFLIGPNYKPTICEYVNITIGDIINDGQRGIKNFTWSLLSLNPINQTNKDLIQNQIIDQANSQKLQLLQFSPNIFLENTEYVFQLVAYNWFDQNSTTLQTIYTTFSEGINLVIKNKEQLTFYRYETIQIKVQIQHVICTSDNVFKQINDSLPYQWQINNDSILNITQEWQYSNPAQDNFAILTFQPYTLEALHNYQLNLTSKLENKTVQQTINIGFNISQASLIAKIVGGSRTASITQPLNLSGFAWDRDLEPSYSQQLEGMIFTWECQDLNTYSPCLDIKNNLIEFQNNKINQTFQRKRFLPYKSYKFTFAVRKGSRLIQTEAILMFLELDLPQLALDTPPSLQSQRINIHEQIFLSMLYSNQYNPDTLFYSGNLIYDFDEVAVMIFDYVTVRFKIWDFYANFTQSNQDLTIRFSIYNPVFIMPSQTTLNVKINTVPYNCILNVIPNIGQALTTSYSISINGCEDEDQPLNYKFYIYMSDQDQQNELINPFSVQRNPLNDFNYQQTLSTILPQGQTKYSMQVVIMASVQDSYGGIANISQKITVNQNQNVINNDTTSYLNQINALYQQTLIIGVDISTKIRLFTIIITELSQSQFVSENNANLIQIQKQILDDLYAVKSLLLIDSPWDQQITKLISILIKNSKGMISSINTAELNNQINNIDQIVLNTGTQLQGIQLDASDDSHAQKMDSQLISCVGVIDGMLNAINTNDSQKQVQQNTTNDQNLKIINLTQSISQYLTINSLPNESPKFYSGESLKIISQIVTPKNLLGYIGQEGQDKDWLGYLEHSESGQQNSTDLQIFKVAFKSYFVNPYATDIKFPYPNQTNKVIDPAIYQGNSTQKINLTQEISHKFVVTPRKTNNTNTTRRQLDQSQVQGSYQYKCAQQQADNIWNKQLCEKTEKNTTDGQLQIKCICKDLAVTTIGEEFVSIFTENKNIDKILSIEGLQSLQGMEWYKYAIFYIGAFITAVWIYLVYYGYQQDKLIFIDIHSDDINEKKQSKKLTIDEISKQLQNFQNNENLDEQNNEIPLINENKNNQQLQQQELGSIDKSIPQNQLKQEDQDTQQQLQIVNQQIEVQKYQENENQKIQQDEQIKNDNQTQDKQIDIINQPLKQLSEQNQEQNIIIKDNQSPIFRKKRSKISKPTTVIIEQNEEKEINLDQLIEDINVNEGDQQINSAAQQKSNVNLNQQTDNQSKESNYNFLNKVKTIEGDKLNNKDSNTNNQIQMNQTPDVEQQRKKQGKKKNQITFKFCNKSFVIGVFSYHELLSIFHIPDPQIKRPVRFTIYYIKVVYFMTITSVFSQQLDAIQNIIFSALSGIAYSIIVGIISQLFKRMILMKIVGSLILIGFCGVCWYSILVVAATLGIFDSNMWAIQFAVTFIVDNFIVQLLSGVFKYSLLIILIQKITNLQGLAKTVSGAIVNILLNAKIKALFDFN